SPPGELTVENEGRSETLAFALVEGVSIIGVKLLDFDIVVGRQFRSGAWIGSRSRTERSQRSQHRSGRKKAASQHGSSSSGGRETDLVRVSMCFCRPPACRALSRSGVTRTW